MEEILEQLRVKFFYTSQKFGGAEAMLQQIAETADGWSVNYKIARLLSHPGPVRVVSPWDLAFTMPGLGEGDSIFTSHPYQINDLDGRLIYKVKTESSTWGESVLDKTLVLQSATGSFFYLSYRTFTGIQQVLLIINNLALRSSAPISDDDLIRVPAPPAIEPSNNYITLDCSALNANSFIVSTLFLKSVAHRPPSVQYLINNASTIREDYYLSREDSTFLFFPKESGWFSLLTDDNSLLRVDDLEGQGDDRFIETNDGLFYIAIGEEMDTNLLRQSMGVISRRPPGFSRDNVIRLSAKVIR